MGKKGNHKKTPEERKVFLVGNFTCYRKTPHKPSLQRPGLLLLENHGRAVVGAPKINPELGKKLTVSHSPPHSHQSQYLKTTEFKNLLTGTTQKSCESSPGTKTKIPGLDLTSKEKKVRDSILNVSEVLPEQPETPTWKKYQGRGFVKKIKIMREEEEKVWNEFSAMLKEKEDFPNWEIVKRRPKKTQKAQNDGQKEKTVKPMWDGGEEEEEVEEAEVKEEEMNDDEEEWNEKVKTKNTHDKYQRGEEEKAWNELLDMIKEVKLEEIVKRRPKGTQRKKVSYHMESIWMYLLLHILSRGS